MEAIGRVIKLPNRLAAAGTILISADGGVATSTRHRRRGVASARAIATSSDESRPPALAASERTRRGAVRVGPARHAPSVARASVS